MSNKGCSLSSLLSHLLPVVDWEILGLHLSIPKYELDKIRIQHHHEGVERCKAEMLHLWLTNYCTSGDESEQWALITDALDKMKHELSEEERSDSPTNSLTIRIQKQWIKRFNRLESKYAKLILDTQQQLEASPVTINELYSYIKALLNFTSIHQSPPHSLEELFDTIREHYCFLNVSLIDNMICTFLEGSTVQVSLEDYERQLDEFKTCTKMEELLELSLSQDTSVTNSTNTLALILKLEGSWMSVTLQRFQQLVEEIFKDNSQYFNHIQVQKGCLEVSVFVPQSLYSSLLSLVKQRTAFMECVGVISIHINDQIVYSSSTNTHDKHSFIDYLKLAISQERSDVVSFLTKGGYINDITSCLETAVSTGNTDIVSYLLSAGANPNSIGERGMTPLQRASRFNMLSIATLLLDHGADPNYTGIDGSTSLMLASNWNHAIIVELLLSKGASINEVMEGGWTALMFACDQCHVSIVNVLLQAGANPNVCTDSGKWAPIHSACSKSGDNTSILISLLSEGADPNAATSSGATPLILATKYQLVNIVDILLSLQLSTLDSQTDRGWTPLMIAVHTQNMSILQSLLRAGCNIYSTDNNGRTALEWALQGGNSEIIQLLLVELDKQTPPPNSPPPSTMKELSIKNYKTNIDLSSPRLPSSIIEFRNAMRHPSEEVTKSQTHHDNTLTNNTLF